MSADAPKRDQSARLSAYIDGELPPVEAATVARAIAENPKLAREVARLTRLKAAVRAVHEPAPSELLPPPRRLRLARTAAAAALVLILAAGAWWLQPTSHAPAPAHPAWEQTARSAHAAWATASAQEGAGPVAGLLLAALQNLGQPAHVPDLSDAKLTLTHVATIQDDPPLLHVAYEGTRGCRVSLFAGAASELGRSLDIRLDEATRVARWRVGAIGYLMLAETMEADRFRVVAETVAKATRERAPLPPESRTRLADSRERSAPCVG